MTRRNPLSIRLPAYTKRVEALKHLEVTEWSRIARIAFDASIDADNKGLRYTAHQMRKHASKYYAEAMKFRLAIVNDEREK